jgi:hypothetical protein
MDFDVLYNSLTDITDSTNSSVSRRPGKPRQQFSPAPEQQKRVQKKPTIDPPVRTKRLEFGDPNVQTQSQLARRLRRIPAQHFRLTFTGLGAFTFFFKAT